MSCMYIYTYLGYIKCNRDIECKNVTDIKCLKIFKMFTLLNISMPILRCRVVV
jgi:hypothetical protein